MEEPPGELLVLELEPLVELLPAPVPPLEELLVLELEPPVPEFVLLLLPAPPLEELFVLLS